MDKPLKIKKQPMKKNLTQIAVLTVGLGLLALAGCSTSSSTVERKSLTTEGATQTILALPSSIPGSNGVCPGAYVGCVTYTKTVSQGWGWKPDTNTTVHTASDGGGRTDTKVEYAGKSGDHDCAQTSVTIPSPTSSTAYRFTIYFPNNVPTTNYPIILSGFNP